MHHLVQKNLQVQVLFTELHSLAARLDVREGGAAVLIIGDVTVKAEVQELLLAHGLVHPRLVIARCPGSALRGLEFAG